MFYFYILYSESIDRFYLGHTSDLMGRLRRHNAYHKGFTGMANDWKIVYQEKFITKTQAYRRELEIKSFKSRLYIQHLIRSAGSEHPD